MTPPKWATTNEEELIDVGAVTATLWRGKWIVLACAVVAAIAGGIYATKIAVPTYRATTELILETRGTQVVDLDSVVGALRPDLNALNTEVATLRSRALMGQTVDALNLTQDPDFNATLRVPTPIDAILTQLRSGIGLGDDADLPTPTPQILRERAISALSEQVSVSNIPDSFVFHVDVQASTAQKAATIANQIGALYIDEQIARKFRATEDATAWLADRVVELAAELRVAEEAVQAFRNETVVSDQAAVAEAEQQLTGLRIRLAEQTRQLNDATSERETARLTAQITTLNRSIADLQGAIAGRTDDLIRFDELTREAESVRLIHDYFLNRLRETSVQQGLQQADSRVLTPAVAAERPASPQKARIVAIALVLGLILGVALTMLREVRTTVLRTPDDVTRVAQRPVIAEIPLIKKRSATAALQYLDDNPLSRAAEAIRNLRTACTMGTQDQTKVIAVTSSVPGEGKTTLTMALTKSLTGTGVKVLLIDADLRRHTATTSAAPDIDNGLRAVLSGAATLNDTVTKSEMLNADFLGAENGAAMASDLLVSPAFGSIIAQARDTYDYVLIDTPPVSVVADARAVAPHVDRILFVTRWNHTKQRQLVDGLRMFDGLDQQPSGVVLNMIDPRRSRQFGYDLAQGQGYYSN